MESVKSNFDVYLSLTQANDDSNTLVELLADYRQWKVQDTLH